MRKKLTPNQRRVLENLAAGRRADSHCVGRSQFGGLTGTLASLRRAELIDLNGLKPHVSADHPLSLGRGR